MLTRLQPAKTLKEPLRPESRSDEEADDSTKSDWVPKASITPVTNLQTTW